MSIAILCVLLISILSSNSIATGKVDLLKQDDVIVYAMPYDFDEYSAYTSDSYATAQWNSAVYASLLKRSPVKHNWEPDLVANMPTISNDGLTFTFVLKNDLIFSNGNELNSDDIKFSFHAALTPAINTNFYNSFIGYLNNESINIIDTHTIEFTLTKTNVFAHSLLSFPIVDEQYFEDRYVRCLDGVENDCLWNDPNGGDVVSAGPFMIENIDNVEEIVTVIANPYYYNAENVFTDKIVFQKISEKNVAISSLASGTIDILDAQYVPAIDELVDIEGIREEYAGDPAHQELALNHLNPYFGTGEGIPGNENASNQEMFTDALLVREAMSHIVNREFVVEFLMEGMGRAAATVMPEGAIGFDDTLIPRNYSVDVARKYMEQAGFDYSTLGNEGAYGVFYNSFFEITMLTPSSGVLRPYMQFADNYALELTKIGIGIKEHVTTGWNVVVPRTFGYARNEDADPGFPLPPSYDDGGYDIFSVGYGWAMDWNPRSLYDASGRCDTGDCSNFYNFDIYENKTDVAPLIRTYLNELDFESRIAKVKDVQQSLYDNIPVLPIYFPRSHWGFNDKLEGIDAQLLSTSAQDWAQVKKEKFVGGPEKSLALPSEVGLSLGLVLGIGLIIYSVYYYNKRIK